MELLPEVDRVTTAQSIIAARRSRFPAQYDGKRLDDSLVMALLESANWAPTHKLTEPWRFKVYCDDGLPVLFENLVRIYCETTPAELVRQAKIDKLKSMASRVSHVVAVIMQRDPAQRVPEIEEVSAVACAVQNMHLALHDFPGAGGYWSTGAGSFSPQMAEYLNLGAQDLCMGFFYLGSVPSEPKPGRRTPLANKVEWVRF